MAVAPCPVIPKGPSSSWVIIIEERHVGSAALEGVRVVTRLEMSKGQARGGTKGSCLLF